MNKVNKVAITYYGGEPEVVLVQMFRGDKSRGYRPHYRAWKLLCKAILNNRSRGKMSVQNVDGEHKSSFTVVFEFERGQQ